MKIFNKFNAGLALGSLTAAVALFAGASAASAQTAPATDTSVSAAQGQLAQAAPGTDASAVAGQAAPGGGSFPGSFLVPGTNTSLKIGGFAKVAIIDDLSSAGGDASDVIAPASIPLRGSATSSLHGNFRFNPRQSNFSFDVRTPTSYGELDTFILTDFFGQNTANAFGSTSGSNTQNARLVLAYGTLGPLLGGQALSLFFDGDALGETVDPTASVGTNNGLTNRQPQIRYTYAGPGGISVAGSVEQPDVEGIDNSIGGFTASSSTFGALGTAPTTTTNAGFAQRSPDFVVRGRWDQAWGHISAAGLVRDMQVITAGAGGLPRYSRVGWGGQLSGHLNTFGKDTLRGEALVGQALGHYLSDMGLAAGLETNSGGVGPAGSTSAVAAPVSYGVNASYTHWWTTQLRSTVMGGYSKVNVNTSSIITAAAIQNGLDKMHIGETVNLIWSPVPQVDLGIEYDHITRVVAGPNVAAGVSSRGNLNRVEAMTVFKF